MNPNNNNPFSTQNSNNYPNPNNYQFPNQSSSNPQHLPKYGYQPNFFMPSAFPNYPPNYGSMMPHPSQTSSYSSNPYGNEVVPNVGATEFPEFSTQMALGGMSDLNEVTPNVEDSTFTRQKSPKWTTAQNLVGGNTGSRSSGSKRAHENDASDSNSVGSSARPMEKDAAKKKLKRKVRVQFWKWSIKILLNLNKSRRRSWNGWKK
ncbi:uncharacterized protein LOC108820186 [Raphanus sativus]|uniref:Uncharacterized protein LOC108820186 n=1 Tax=Raphanus sativus TaxID=3726 RepID=A0A9W3BX49_RAPSA|nr:uncharacterized protein LOC108820186 [Raphanus sativus]